MRTTTSTTARERPPRRARLGLRYRAGWRVTYVLLGLYGPAQLGGDGQPDPRTTMLREREGRQKLLDAQPRPALR